jgi:hypothetical protein
MMDAYFEIMHAYLSGVLSEGDAAAQLGRAGFVSPAHADSTRAASFGVYRELVRRQWRATLDSFFHAAKTHLDHAEPKTWETLAQAFHATHPPVHGNPVRFCEPFFAFLEARSAGAALLELVDYTIIRYRAMHTAHVSLPRLERDIFARTYAFDVVAFCEQIECEGRPAPAELLAAQNTVLIGRSRIGGRLRVLRSSLGALEATESGAQVDPRGASDAALPEGLTRTLVEQERAVLMAEGLLP